MQSIHFIQFKLNLLHILKRHAQLNAQQFQFNKFR